MEEKTRVGEVVGEASDPIKPLPDSQHRAHATHLPLTFSARRRREEPLLSDTLAVGGSSSSSSSRHGLHRRRRGRGRGRGGVHVRAAAGVVVHPPHDAQERHRAGPAGDPPEGPRGGAVAGGGGGAAPRGADQPRRGGDGGPHAPPARLLRRRAVPDGGQGRQVLPPLLRRAGVQVARPQRGRRLHGRARAHEPGQGPHGELVLPEGRCAGRWHPVQQGVRHDGVRVPRHGPPLQPCLQRGHEEPLGDHHQEAPRVLHRLRRRRHPRRRRRRHRRHAPRHHLRAPADQGRQLRPPPRDLRGAAVPRRAARRRRHVQVGPRRRRDPHEVDPPRLERRPLRHHPQELLRRAAGQRQGDHRRVRAAGEPGGDPQGAGRVPRRHDHARPQPRRQGEVREGVQGARQGRGLHRVQGHIHLCQRVGHRVHQVK